MSTPDVMEVFEKENDSPIYKGKYISNATIILGKRGNETVNILRTSKISGELFLYHELFVNLAFHSKINVCEDPAFPQLQQQASRINPGFEFNCDFYGAIANGTFDSELRMVEPFFVKG